MAWLTWFPPTGGSSFEGSSGVRVILMLPIYYLYAYGIVCLGYVPVRHSARALQFTLWVMALSAMALLVVVSRFI